MPTTCERAARPAHRAGQARAALVQALVADLLVQAQRLARARARESLPGGEAGAALRLAHVGEHAEPADASLPELIEITGTPAFTARRIAGPRPGSGTETTSPSGLLATAASTCAIMRSRL